LIVKNYFSSQRQWHSCDCPVCKTDTVAETLHDLFARLGGIDTIVVNAGANDVTNIGQDDLQKELKLIDTNLSGAIATISAATGRDPRHPGGAGDGAPDPEEGGAWRRARLPLEIFGSLHRPFTGALLALLSVHNRVRMLDLSANQIDQFGV
jgi:NAD(P)-dependent dehydrogenase (short-subunit alcohol dehydrogenase family)